MINVAMNSIKRISYRELCPKQIYWEICIMQISHQKLVDTVFTVFSLPIALFFFVQTFPVMLLKQEREKEKCNMR